MHVLCCVLYNATVAVYTDAIGGGGGGGGGGLGKLFSKIHLFFYSQIYSFIILPLFSNSYFEILAKSYHVHLFPKQCMYQSTSNSHYDKLHRY